MQCDAVREIQMRFRHQAKGREREKTRSRRQKWRDKKGCQGWFNVVSQSLEVHV